MTTPADPSAQLHSGWARWTPETALQQVETGEPDSLETRSAAEFLERVIDTDIIVAQAIAEYLLHMVSRLRKQGRAPGISPEGGN